MPLIQIDTENATFRELTLTARLLCDLAGVEATFPMNPPNNLIDGSAGPSVDRTGQTAVGAPAAPAAPSVLSSPTEEAPAKKPRRSRRTKAEMIAARRAAESEAPAGAPEMPATQEAVVENTFSAPADAPPCAAEGVSSSDGAEAEAPTLSPDDFKAKMQEFGQTENGLVHVIAALNAAGYERIREVPPEQYRDVLAKCADLCGKG